MPNEHTIEEKLVIAKKIEKAMKERTEQITAALEQSQKELEAAILTREELEARLKGQ
jgi:hypothetical protein